MLCCGGDGTKETKGNGDVSKVTSTRTLMQSATAPPPPPPPSMPPPPSAQSALSMGPANVGVNNFGGNMCYGGRGPPPKTSGISEEVFRQIETVQNRYDSSTAAAFRSVQKSGEMVVRTLDPRQFIRLASETAPKINIDTNDPDSVTSFVEVVKRPGQTLGLYIREGNGQDRGDGVFISRIAIESAIYGSGCLQIGDEILAVNLVDVTHMSLDDVVIIMSIPRRLVLTTRRPLGQPGRSAHNATNNHNNSFFESGLNQQSTLPRATEYNLPTYRDSRTLTWDRNPKPDRNDPKYFPVSSLPRNAEANGHAPDGHASSHTSGHAHLRGPLVGQTSEEVTNSSFDEPHLPMPPPMRELSARDYNKAVGNSADFSVDTNKFGNNKFNNNFTASFSDEYASDTSMGLSRGQRLLHRMAADRASNVGRHNGYGRRSNTLQYRHNHANYRVNRYTEPTSETEAMHHSLSPANESLNNWSASFARSNSLPRNFQREALLRHPELSMEMDRLIEATGPDDPLINNDEENGIDNVIDNVTNEHHNIDDDNNSNAPFAIPNELGDEGVAVDGSGLRLGSMYPYSSRSETLRRTPSTSAIYETLRKSKELRESLSRPSSRLSNDSFSDTRRTHELVSHSYFSDSEPPHLEALNNRRLHSRRARHRTLSTSAAATAELTSAVTARLMHHRPASALAKSGPLRTLPDFNPNDFTRYKSSNNEDDETDHENHVRLSGLLTLHLLSGRGLRMANSTENNGNNSGSTKRVRDLYCVVEVDHIHKARTVVRTGGSNFDWDEKFDVDLANNLEMEFLIYSWDPQLRHRLCYRATLRLALLFGKGQNYQQTAVQLHPLGTLYLTLGYKTLEESFERTLSSDGGLFGVPLETLIDKENVSVPIIVQRCLSEVERRGLDIIGIYRLCGSNAKKEALRKAFERDAQSVQLDSKHVPDINVVTGLLRQFLRQLPQPVVTCSLYEMLVDAMAVFLPDDPDGNAKLVFSILDCLPKANRNCLVLLMDHLCRVACQAEKNKMNAQNLSICFAPVLMLDFGPNTKINENNENVGKTRPSASSISEAIRILKYLIEIWPQNQT